VEYKKHPKEVLSSCNDICSFFLHISKHASFECAHFLRIRCRICVFPFG
jgi:hypothetical protein